MPLYSRTNSLDQLDQTILIVVNSAWNLVNFRAGLIKGLKEKGFRVVAVAPVEIDRTFLEDLGCEFHEVKLLPQSLNPWGDLLFMVNVLWLIKRTRAKACLFYTAKPNVYGSLGARLLGVPYINNISGLGSVFIGEGWLVKLMTFLYRVALKGSSCVFFQNPDDRDLFIQQQIVRREQTQLLPGSGVNLEQFKPSGLVRSSDQAFTFVLIARLIKDKGVVEFIEAAQKVHQTHPDVEFQLLGFLGVQNPTAISKEKVEEWTQLPYIHYLGAADDVRPFIERSDCVVLPSYREGTPKVLLEAAAMGKPIIATRVPGCKEVVEDDVTGYLCEVKSPHDLAQKMVQMIELSAAQRARMGQLGRLKMEQQFSEQIVIDRYLVVLQALP
jgi:glycosyltransferase involved in cell wall biosynthesis